MKKRTKKLTSPPAEPGSDLSLDADGRQKALRQKIEEDVKSLKTWMEENGVDALRSICASVADLVVQGTESTDANLVCARVFDKIFPDGADNLMLHLLTAPTPSLLKVVGSCAGPELGKLFRSIVFEYSPRILARTAEEEPEVWKSLEAVIATDHVGGQELALTFTRRDNQKFVIRGSPRAAIGEVLPKIVRVLARAETLAVNQDEVAALQSAFRELEKKMRRSRSKPGV